MSPTSIRRAGLACLVLSACVLGQVGAAMADQASEIAAVRAAADKYRDVDVALADGYIRDPANHCFTADMAGLPTEYGAMGIHYFSPQLLKVTATAPRVDGESTYTDWSKPAVLIYEPQADGSLELVGVENLVFLKSWEAAGHSAPPEFAGRVWDHMADDPATAADEAHGFTPHYDQHVWAFRDNPRGNLEPFNSAVSCEHHVH
ncbi:MAG: uncharacterized protein JWQ89_948 [Devosia sp.]|uniref:hypothetical protein n=1 Tax=Devosia sp. TaxID=1871048 RepID=UPI00261CFBE9|nr:hypothetical protein [Devosia sp.]MDB5539221.1 uncharacterized protein [Devosia sp.]